VIDPALSNEAGEVINLLYLRYNFGELEYNVVSVLCLFFTPT